MKKSTIKEKDLVKLGFKKVKVSAEESGDTPYYYYTKDFWRGPNNFCLLSGDSDNVETKGWPVEFLEEPRIRFTDAKTLTQFVNIIEKIKLNNRKK